MTTSSFYSSNLPEYHWQKPHYNLGNKIVHSDLYKTLNPIRARYDYNPNDYSQMPSFLGYVPQASWVYGNLDYSFNKHHKLYQAHDDWYPDRKNKSLGFSNGGICDSTKMTSKYMILQPSYIPRGCYREIRKYQFCTEKKSDEACFNEKINIMEVCADHILEGLKERKKWYLRAETIDNETYKRAMSVSSYNQGRSVSDLKLKTWEYGKGGNLRSDSIWQDDRYNPTKYSHPHRYDNVNFPEQEFKDIFGGTLGEAERKEQAHYKLGLLSGSSKAQVEFEQKQRELQTQGSVNKGSTLKDAVREVNQIAGHHSKHDSSAQK